MWLSDQGKSDQKHIDQLTMTQQANQSERTVTRVRIDRLEETEGNPDVDSEDVEVLCEPAVQERSADRARSENQDFSRMSVLGGETKRRAVLVMDLVDVLVERTVVQSLVRKVVERVFKYEEERNLVCDGGEGRHGYLPGRHATSFGEGVEEPDLGELDGEVGEEHELCAFPLLFCRGYFSLETKKISVAHSRKSGEDSQAGVSTV
jgi:hypothetical protein